MKPNALYMFAIMPPKYLSARIHELRKEFAERFHFLKALKPPVHITLHEPFRIDHEHAQSFERQVSKLHTWARAQHAFDIQLQDYNFFNNAKRPVVYIDVKKNDRLKALRISFLRELSKYINTGEHKDGYSPHITIGYRDVTPEAFPSIRTYYSQQAFSGAFDCHRFHLWRHNGKNWQVVQTFELSEKEEQLSLF